MPPSLPPSPLAFLSPSVSLFPLSQSLIRSLMGGIRRDECEAFETSVCCVEGRGVISVRSDVSLRARLRSPGRQQMMQRRRGRSTQGQRGTGEPRVHRGQRAECELAPPLTSHPLDCAFVCLIPPSSLPPLLISLYLPFSSSPITM